MSQSLNVVIFSLDLSIKNFIMIIAVDFDGTIVEHEYPKIGKPIPFAFETLRRLQQENHRLILWTVREGDLLQEAIDFCAKNGVEFYAHNANFPEEKLSQDFKGSCRKLKADLFIDDRNLGGLPDWGVIYDAVLATRRGESAFRKIMEYDPEANRKSKGGLFSIFGK